MGTGEDLTFQNVLGKMRSVGRWKGTAYCSMEEQTYDSLKLSCPTDAEMVL